jgi:hypothetical protein
MFLPGTSNDRASLRAAQWDCGAASAGQLSAAETSIWKEQLPTDLDHGGVIFTSTNITSPDANAFEEAPHWRVAA